MAAPKDGRDGNGRNKDGSSPSPAVRNDDLTDQEIFKLLDRLLDARDPLDCPLPDCLYGKFHQIQFLDFHPADIYEKYAKDEVNGYIYFYSRMEFLGNGITRKRKVRAVNGGVWMARRNKVVKEKNVDGVAVNVGMKIPLVFYEKRPSIVTGWTMHEFTKIIEQAAPNKFSVFAVYRLYNKEGRNCEKKKPEKFAAEAAGHSAPNMDKLPAPALMAQPPPGLAGQANTYAPASMARPTMGLAGQANVASASQPYAPASMARLPPGPAGQANLYAPASMARTPTGLTGQANGTSTSQPYAPAWARPGLTVQVKPYAPASMARLPPAGSAGRAKPYAPASVARPLTGLAGQANVASASHPYAPASMRRPPPGLVGQANVVSTSQPYAPATRTPPRFTGHADMPVAARLPGQSASMRAAFHIAPVDVRFTKEAIDQLTKAYANAPEERIVRSACGTQPQERSSSSSSPTAAAAAAGGVAVPGGDAMQQAFLESSGVPIDGTVAAPIRTEDDKGAYDDEMDTFLLEEFGLTPEEISEIIDAAAAEAAPMMIDDGKGNAADAGD